MTSSRLFKFKNINKYVTSFLGTLVGFIVLLSVPASADSVNRMVFMGYDPSVSNNSAAYSMDEAYSGGGYLSYSYLQQVSPTSNPYIIQEGGSRIVVLLNDGTVLTKDDPYSNWVTQTTGARWVTIGSNGELMVIDSAGNAYSKMGTYDPWVQQTSGGSVKDVAVGGNGRLMVIDSAGNAYSKESTYDAWMEQVTGAKWIGVGSSGRMVVVDSAWNIYYKDLPNLVWNIAYGPGLGQSDAYYVGIN